MIMCFLKSLAWKILDDEIRKHYIQRSHFTDYTQWMSRDFPVFEDTYEFFKDRPYGQCGNVANHREEMKDKYIGAKDET